MKKIFFLIGILLAITLLPSFASADTASQLTGGLSKDGFTLQDLSFKYLQDIFGVVDGVLHGTGTQIMGRMFGVLNSAVLALGFMVLAYILFVSTLNTAHQGQVLGKNWSSIWIPLRTVVSVGLLVPKATGYSAIQIFMMWVVLQGILAADAVMFAGLSYIKQGGVLIQSSPPPDSGMVKIAGDIFKAEVCMYGYANSLTNRYGSDNQIPTFAPTPVTVMIPTPPPTYAYVFFPSNDTPPMSGSTVNFGGVCGKVSWKPWIDNDANTSQSTSSTSSSDTSTGYDIRGVATQQVILDLLPLAQQIANVIIPVPPDATTSSLGDVLSANINQLIFAAADYKGIMMPVVQMKGKERQSAAQNAVKKVAENGWVTLGSLYYALASVNNNYDANDKEKPGVYFSPKNSNSAAWNMISDEDKNKLYCTKGEDCPNDVLTSATAEDNQTDGGNIDKDTKNIIDAYLVTSWQNTDAGGAYKKGNSDPGGNKKGVVNKILSAIFGPFYTIPNSIALLTTAEQNNTDPIIAITQLGSGILNLVTQIWVGLAATIFTLTIVAGAVPCLNSVGLGILATLMWLLPMVGAILIGMFVTGAMMAFYVPLIPFILFTFGAIGWFAAVIETMIAAPLVALGIAVPEGHDVFGRSVSSIMLLTNVFIRPTLMVFGFFAGAILSHVGLWLLNKGFVVAWGMAVADNITNLGGGVFMLGNFNPASVLGLFWTVIAALLIYVTLVITIINQTFGLIHQLPDQIMRWLGGSGMQTLGASPSEALSSAKGGLESGMKVAGEATAKAGETMNEASMESIGGKKGSGSASGKK